MPRNMSFSMTTQQIENRTKDITRRFGWDFLKPGDQINAVEKAMGLKKGQKVKKLALIEIISIRQEPLNEITPDDLRREGFPDWTPQQFIDMLVQHNNVAPTATVNRIEFKYLG